MNKNAENKKRFLLDPAGKIICLMKKFNPSARGCKNLKKAKRLEHQGR